MLNLLALENNDGAVVADADGVYSFGGNVGLQVTSFGAVSAQFSVYLRVRQSLQPGYLLAKTTMLGSRYYALFSDPQLGTLTFFYHLAGASSEAAERFLTVPASLATGEFRHVLVSVDGATLNLTVDDGAVRTFDLEGTVADCALPGPDCTFYVGQRSVVGTAVGRFTGAFTAAVLYLDEALTALPAFATTTTAAPTTTTTTVMTTTTITTTATTTAPIATTTTGEVTFGPPIFGFDLVFSSGFGEAESRRFTTAFTAAAQLTVTEVR